MTKTEQKKDQRTPRELRQALGEVEDRLDQVSEVIHARNHYDAQVPPQLYRSLLVLQAWKAAIRYALNRPKPAELAQNPDAHSLEYLDQIHWDEWQTIYPGQVFKA